MAKQTKKGSDKTPNHLFGGIILFPGSEGADYHETGNQYNVPEGFVASPVSAEDVLVERLQIAAANTRGTDHNTVFRLAGLLNYVAKQQLINLFYKASQTGTEYHLPMEGGYLSWVEG